MTVVRLSGGKLWLHSPIAMSPGLISELSALGGVAHIICYNAFHHMYAGPACAAFPKAQLYGPAQLKKKRRDLHFDAELSESPPASWQGVLQPLAIRGSLLRAAVFYHRPSRTLITSDLMESFTRCDRG